jgi:hypothetical protein
MQQKKPAILGDRISQILEETALNKENLESDSEKLLISTSEQLKLQKVRIHKKLPHWYCYFEHEHHSWGKEVEYLRRYSFICIDFFLSSHLWGESILNWRNQLNPF